MSSIVEGFFGGGKTKSTAGTTYTYSDPASFSVNLGGRTGLSLSDGSVSLGDSNIGPYAGRIRRSIAGQRSRISGMITDLKSNNNPFIKARIRPLEQALRGTLADQARDFAQRGVFGALSQNEQTKARFIGEQALNDERAKATDEALSSLFDAEASLRGVNQDELMLAELMMKEELMRLGISLEALGLSLNSRQQLSGATDTIEREPRDILGGIGKLITLGSL